MNYLYLGKLPAETIEFFKNELMKRKVNRSYQWIPFDKILNKVFLDMFINTELKIQWSKLPDSKPIQKAFYSEPGHGFRIHKDGIMCKSALNIAVSCNPGDWIRWYDDDYINSIGQVSAMTYKVGTSRDVNIMDYEPVPFIEERRSEIGDVYVVNTDTYHSFKCNGPLPRIVIQTKFDEYPDFDTISESLSKQSFSNLIV